MMEITFLKHEFTNSRFEQPNVQPHSLLDTHNSIVGISRLPGSTRIVTVENTPHENIFRIITSLYLRIVLNISKFRSIRYSCREPCSQNSISKNNSPLSRPDVQTPIKETTFTCGCNKLIILISSTSA